MVQQGKCNEKRHILNLVSFSNTAIHGGGTGIRGVMVQFLGSVMARYKAILPLEPEDYFVVPPRNDEQNRSTNDVDSYAKF